MAPAATPTSPGSRFTANRSNAIRRIRRSNRQLMTVRLESKRLAHGFVEQRAVDQQGQLRTSAWRAVSFLRYPRFFFSHDIQKIGRQAARVAQVRPTLRNRLKGVMQLRGDQRPKWLRPLP